MPYVAHGRTLPLDTPFELDSVRYPANWLRLSTQADRNAAGITWEPDPDPYDQRFYWGYDAEGNLIPKDHTQLVEQWTQQTRHTANTLLQPTDWIIIREADNGKEADPLIKIWRQDVRFAAGDKITAIGATLDTPELAAYITGADYPAWPSDPYAPAQPAPTDGVEPVVDGVTSGF
jgi:hypothetical protein